MNKSTAEPKEGDGSWVPAILSRWRSKGKPSSMVDPEEEYFLRIEFTLREFEARRLVITK